MSKAKETTFKVTLRPKKGEKQTFMSKGPDGEPYEREIVRHVVLAAESAEHAVKAAETQALELSTMYDVPELVVETVEEE